MFSPNILMLDKLLFIIKEFFILIGLMIIGILIVGLFGAFVGLLLAMALASNYKKRSPSDPGDAPVYVGIGFVFLGVALGAILGLALAVLFYLMRFGRNSHTAPRMEIT
jgi:hypothetical protein